MRRAQLSLLLALSLSSPAIAYDLVPSEYASEELPRVEVLSAHSQGLTIDFELPELITKQAIREGVEFLEISISGGGARGAIGEPTLPTFSRLIAIPNGMKARVRAEPVQSEDLVGVRLLPRAVNEQDTFAEDRVARTRAATLDAAAAVEVSEPAYLRDLRVVSLTFQPVAYDAQQETLRITSQMRVEVEFVHDPAATEPPVHQPSVPASFERLYRATVLNYEGEARASTQTPGTYLLICPANTGADVALQPLIDWRNRQGTPVILATTAETGTSAPQIKNYIQAVYDDPAVSLEYVAIVGDVGSANTIATWYENLSFLNGEGDLPYSQLSGDDPLPDVHLGRISVNSTTTLEYVVSKILGYEMTPEIDHAGWYGRSCLVGDPIPSGLSTILASRWTADRLSEIGHTQADSIFSAPWVSQMKTALDRGDSIFTYRGIAGMSGWSNAWTYTLANAWKMPFSVIITCDTGSFASGLAVTEGFLRGWNPTGGVPRGAIGAIGMATLGTHTRYNNCTYYGILRGLIQEGQHTMGGALTRGALEMFLNYGSTQLDNVIVWNHWTNLMGDPAVDVWTSYPEVLDVTYPASVAVGTNSVTVVVAESSTPIEEAKVCLSKDGETYVVGLTDAAGRVELPVVTETAGDLLLTVTKHNKHPHLATIPVALHPSFVGYTASTVDDDASGESSGNGDGMVNPGETIELPVQLQNFGTQAESGIVATLVSTDPYVTIDDDTETFGSLGIGGTVWSLDDFDVTIDAGCPDGHIVVLGLDVTTSSGGPWHSQFEVATRSAALQALEASVQDGGNARLDPGETAQVTVPLRNNGTVPATGVTGTLRSLSSLVTIDDGAGSFGTIAVDGSGANSADPFTVSLDGGIYEGYVAAFELVTSFNNGTADSTEFQLTVGARSSNDPVGPDAHGYLAFDNTDTDYTEAPIYHWIELDPAYGGDGTEIVLADYGKYEDDSQTVDLPFVFNYYGESYTQATVCSNGWVAMGATGSVVYRNWTIPGAGGPNAMIAPYWDNLYQDEGSRVFQKYDAANHAWIVEWSRMRNDFGVGNDIQTFQAILYDPAHHVTTTGDGQIVFQYETVSNPDNRNGNATVGIESPDQFDGLLYTYFNEYAAGAAPLEAGRAIKIEPAWPGPTGTLAGTALNQSNGDAPIEGVRIALLEYGRRLETGVDGNYFGRVPAGIATVVASHPSFAPDTIAGVTILESEMTTLDFSLIDNAPPSIAVTEHPTTEETIGPYPIPVTIEEISGITSMSLFFSTAGATFTQVALQPQGGDNFLAEIPGQPHGTMVRYYVEATDTPGLIGTAPAGAPSATFWFLVDQLDLLLEEDYEEYSGWSVGAPGDDAQGGHWVRADPVGSLRDGYQIQPEDDHTPSPGTICFVTGNAGPDDDAAMNDIDGGKTTLVSPVFALGGQLAAEVSYWIWYTNNRGNSPGNDFWVVEATDDGVNWVALENTTESTGEAWVQRHFLLQEHISLTNQVQFRFVASDEGSSSLVEAAVDDFRIIGVTDVYTGAEDGVSLAIREHQLESVQPNPFHDQAQITFALASPGRVSLQVYDVAGRLISTLVDGTKESGRYRMEWDGRDDAGRKQASGVYFARYTAPGFTQVRRITLLR